MLKVIPIVLFFLISDILSAQSSQSSVWRISKDNHSLYIGGTCHLLRSFDYPLPEEFELAYEAADTLVFEMNPEIAGTSDFAMKLLRKASYEDSRGLKKILSKQVYNELSKQCFKSGLSLESLDKMKPFIVIMTLLLQELKAYGVSEEGVDLHFYKRAASNKKQIRFLETPDFQIDLITSIGEGFEDELVLYGLEDIDNIQTRFDDLVHAWRKGEMADLEKNFIAQIRNYPDLYSRILVDRNLKWIDTIKQYLTDPEVEFVLVGIAHLAGEKGLVTLLKKEGYVIEQVAITPTNPQ